MYSINGLIYGNYVVKKLFSSEIRISAYGNYVELLCNIEKGARILPGCRDDRGIEKKKMIHSESSNLEYLHTPCIIKNSRQNEIQYQNPERI